jgi:hypothetical protein
MYEDIKKVFLMPMIAAIKEVKIFRKQPIEQSKRINSLLRYLISMFQFLTVCCHSQQGFIDQILTDNLAIKEFSQEL